MKAYLAFTPYYHEKPILYNIGNLSLLIFDSTEHPSDRYSPRVFQEDIIAFLACLKCLLPFAPKVTCHFSHRRLRRNVFGSS